MINSKKELKYYIEEDAKAVCFAKGITRKFTIALRKLEFYTSMKGIAKYRYYLPLVYWKCRFHRLSILCGFSIPLNTFGPGLALPHYGSIVVNSRVKAGKNCRILTDVTIGATNHSAEAPVIGDNVFIGSGAKIIGNITIANDVAIGANATVVKSILEEGTTWAGTPAKKISSNSARLNLSKDLFY